jgi:predicted phosphodiesterase
VLASDIHNNLLTLPAVERFSRGHPVFLTGDFTINGSRMEAAFLRGLEDLGDPVVAVSGNHDSPGLMRQLARRGLTVLTHRGQLGADGQVRGPAVRSIAGLKVAAFEDPLQYRGGDFPDGVRAALSFGDFPDGHERFLDAVEERWRWWRELPERPQVLLVHQEAIGRALAHLIFSADPEGPPLAILAGHTHRQRLDRIGPVTVVNSGSAGAGGIFGAGRDDVGLALLDFTIPGALEAADLVRMDPLSAAASARRIITGRPDCDERVVFCAEEPELPDIPSVTVPGPPSGPGSPATR